MFRITCFVGSLRQAPLLRKQDIALHSLSLLEMLVSPLFRYDVGWKGTETMARSEGATAFFADNDSDIEFAYINMLYFTVESAADLFAILCVSDLLFHSLTQDLHPRDRVKDLSTSSTFLLLARLSFILQSEADLAACIVSGVVFHILFAFPTDSSALALKAEQFKTLKSLVCLLDLLGLDGTIWLDAAFKLDERMAHGVSTDKCPYSTTAALLLAMLHRSTFEAVY